MDVRAILADGAANRARHVIDRCGKLRNLALQLLRHHAGVRQCSVDVRLIRGDDLAHLRGDRADVLDDVLEPRLPLRSADRAAQRGRDRLYVVRDGGHLIRDVVHRRRLAAHQDDLLLLGDHRQVLRAGIDVDVLLAEESEVRHFGRGVRVQRHVVVDLHVHLRFAVRTNVNAGDLPLANAGDAHGGLVIEAGHVGKDRADLAHAVAADVDVLDLENEERHDAEGEQHEGADFCCRGHGWLRRVILLRDRIDSGFPQHSEERSKW